MQTIDARKLEEEERQRKQKLEESRKLRQQREEQRGERKRRERVIVFDDDDDEEPEVVQEKEVRPRSRVEEYDREFELENGRKRGKNEVPDVDSWFKRKLGNMFNEDMNRDSKM